MSVRSISSRENPQYKQLKQLAGSAQARRKAAQTVLDGVHLCEAWLQHKGTPALCVVSDSAQSNPEVAKIIAECERRHGDCIVLSDALFAPLSQVAHGVDLLFMVDTPQTANVGIDVPSVLLDGLQDPGNLGSILRTAAAAGIRRVFCSAGTVAAWSPKVLRAGMGAHFVLEIVEEADLPSLIAAARVPVYATSSYAAQPLYDCDLRQPSAWLFGHEGKGVSDALLQQADQRIAIPQDPRIESLNVAASAAICLFEQLRQQLGATKR